MTQRPATGQAPLPMNRRTFIATTAATATTFAGCLGGPGGAQSEETDSMATDESSEMTGTMDGFDEPLGGHPAATDLADQPALGPDPTTASAVIISFSDPSCPSCARFESNTFPEIESELVEPGKAAFVYRNMPIIYPWGESAIQALEATFAHDTEAFWALKNHYFAEQSSFDTDNVLSKTESFLAENTDVDAGTVVSEAEEKEYDDLVQADLAAGNDAGVHGTPTSFLFKDGEHVTTVSGPKSYTVFAEALGV